MGILDIFHKDSEKSSKVGSVGYLYDADGGVRFFVPVFRTKQDFRAFNLGRAMKVPRGSKVRIEESVEKNGVRVSLLEKNLPQSFGFVIATWIQTEPLPPPVDRPNLKDAITSAVIDQIPDGQLIAFVAAVLDERSDEPLPEVWQEADGILAAEFWIADSGIATYLDRDKDEIEAAIKGYIQLGANQQAAILKEAIGLYQRLEMDDDSRSRKIEELTDKWYAIDSNLNGKNLLTKYLRNHVNEFELPMSNKQTP
jgi:hypothetical protein